MILKDENGNTLECVGDAEEMNDRVVGMACPACGSRAFSWNRFCDECGQRWFDDYPKMEEEESQ
jgi:uncharacterized OB-fold protein